MINIGDEVIIIDGSGYKYTKEGAIGKVLSINGSYIKVKWDYDTLAHKHRLRRELPCEWTVRKEKVVPSKGYSKYQSQVL